MGRVGLVLCPAVRVMMLFPVVGVVCLCPPRDGNELVRVHGFAPAAWVRTLHHFFFGVVYL